MLIVPPKTGYICASNLYLFIFSVFAVSTKKKNSDEKKVQNLVFLCSLLTNAGGVGNLRRFHSEATSRAVSVEQKPAWMKALDYF